MLKELSRLEAVDIREVWPDEAQDFTPWLAEEENLDILGETLGIELEFEAQEKDVGDFRADILCRDTLNNSRVLIENQLERTDHTHLGQILTYAAGLEIHTVIWIAKEFREEHRAALDRLNEVTTENFQCFGIEVKMWQIGDSARAPQFDVVSKPNDWNRTVSRDTRRAVNQELPENQQRQIRYWTGLQEYMIEKGSSLSCPSPRPSRYRGLSIGRTDFWLMIWQTPTRSEIGIWLCIDGENREAYFHLLQEEQDDIHTEMGEELEWIELLGKQRNRICLHKEDTDPQDESDWPQQFEWFTTKLERFNQVFRPRIRTLNAADWIPEDDAP